MGAFDKYSNKPDNAPFLGVTFGFGKPLLEVELNEAQQIQNDKMISLMGIRGDCVIDRDGFSYDGTTLTINTKIVKDGIMINTTGATLALTNGESAYISSEVVDYVYSDTIRANGNTSGSSIKNSLIDDRVNIETSHRKGYKFTLNKNSGMLLGTVIGGEFICLASDYISGICRYIGISISAKSKKGGLKLNRLYGRSEQNGIPTPDSPIAIKSVVNPKVTVTGNNKEEQSASLKYTLNAIPVDSNGNITINSQQYIADYVDFEKKQLVRMAGKIKSYDNEEITTNYISTTGELSTGATVIYELSTSTTVDLTDEEVQAFHELATYYPETNIFTSSDQLDPLVFVELSAIESSARLIKAENDISELEAKSSQLTTNLLNPDFGTTEIDGVTCTNNGDGTYTLNGTYTGSDVYAFFWIYASLHLEAGTYKMVGLDKDYPNAEISFGGSLASIYTKDGKIITRDSGDYSLCIAAKKDFTCENIVIKPMLTTNLNATYDDFVPYTGDSGRLNEDVANIMENALVFKRTLTASDDLNAIFETGIYNWTNGSNGVPTNRPIESKNNAQLEVINNSRFNTVFQRVNVFTGGAWQIYQRILFNGEWSDWHKVITENNGDVYTRISHKGTGHTDGSILQVLQINSETGDNLVEVKADVEGGNLRLRKGLGDGKHSHLEFDTFGMNGSNGFARIYLGNESHEVTKMFQFNEDGSFQDGNGVSTTVLNNGTGVCVMNPTSYNDMISKFLSLFNSIGRNTDTGNGGIQPVLIQPYYNADGTIIEYAYGTFYRTAYDRLAVDLGFYFTSKHVTKELWIRDGTLKANDLVVTDSVVVSSSAPSDTSVVWVK